MGNYSKNKGRQRKERYVMLEHHMLNCHAYKHLSFKARVLYIEFKMRYNGSNNGKIHLSIASASKELNCSRNTIRSALKELEEKGFIIYRFKGKFSHKVHRASEYILTEYSHGENLATKDYMKWQPENWKEED